MKTALARSGATVLLLLFDSVSSVFHHYGLTEFFGYLLNGIFSRPDYGACHGIDVRDERTTATARTANTAVTLRWSSSVDGRVHRIRNREVQNGRIFFFSTTITFFIQNARQECHYFTGFTPLSFCRMMSPTDYAHFPFYLSRDPV